MKQPVVSELTRRKMVRIGLLRPTHSEDAVRAANRVYQVAGVGAENPRDIMCPGCFQFYNEEEIKRHVCRVEVVV